MDVKSVNMDMIWLSQNKEMSQLIHAFNAYLHIVVMYVDKIMGLLEHHYHIKDNLLVEIIQLII